MEEWRQHRVGPAAPDQVGADRSTTPRYCGSPMRAAGPDAGGRFAAKTSAGGTISGKANEYWRKSLENGEQCNFAQELYGYRRRGLHSVHPHLSAVESLFIKAKAGAGAVFSGDSALDRVAGHHGGGVQFQAIHDGGTMEFSSTYGDIQFTGDFFGRTALRNEPQHLKLPVGESTFRR